MILILQKDVVKGTQRPTCLWKYRAEKGGREEVFGSPVGFDTTPEFHHSTLSVAIGVYRNPGDKDKTQTQLLSFAIKRVMLGYEKNSALQNVLCAYVCVMSVTTRLEELVM